MSKLNLKPKVVKIANVEDLSTGNATETLRFKKVDGDVGVVSLKRSILREPKLVTAILLDRNAVLPTEEEEAEKLVEAAIALEPTELIAQAATMGWQEHNAFVMPWGVIGKSTKLRQYTVPAWLNEKHAIRQNKAGSLKEWQEAVAKPCLGSSVAIAALCAAFAAPLLQASARQSFGLNIFGVSKAGKTAALLAAASVGGIGHENRLPNHHSTGHAKSELARLFNDQMLPLNEVGLLAGGRKNAYALFRELIYNLAEGRDRIRLSESKFAVAANVAEYRTIFISTAEHSFDWYAKQSSERRDEGEYARCLDIPATKGKRKTIMDLIEVPGSSSKSAALARRRVVAIRKATQTQRGEAFSAYISYLLEKHQSIESRTDKLIQSFCSGLAIDDIDAALQHAAGNFGLLYAGGVLAIKAKVLPYKTTTIKKVLSELFVRSIEPVTKSENADQVVSRILKEKLAIVPRAPKTSKASHKTMPAFYRITDGARKYTVFATEFKNWFKRKDLLQAALIYLDHKETLITRPSKQLRRSNTNEWAVKYPRWPNKKPARAFVFKDPFSSE